MADYNIKRNGSCYIDPTAYQAINDAPKGGEIWRKGTGQEALVLKNHGTMCTVLPLIDQQKPGTVEVISRQVMYANPCFATFAFNQDLGQYIKRLPDKDYTDIMARFAEAMGVTIKVKKAEQPERDDLSEVTYKALYQELLDKLVERAMI